MSNLIEIQSQITKLQKQASDIKAKEFDKTVREIIAKMQAFGITAKDLQQVSSRRGKSGAPRGATARPKSAKKPSALAVAAKYRGPNGEAWSGRGLMPRWMSALVARGQTKDSFLIAK